MCPCACWRPLRKKDYTYESNMGIHVILMLLVTNVLNHINLNQEGKPSSMNENIE